MATKKGGCIKILKIQTKNLKAYEFKFTKILNNFLVNYFAYKYFFIQCNHFIKAIFIFWDFAKN